MTRLFFDHALLDRGWATDVLLEIDAAGWITGIREAAEGGGADHRGAIALPGLPNLHSHAFQRAMAGLTETAGPEGDDFWTWRRAMYRFVERLTPDDLAAIATQLYIEMLQAGFTAVAEFHYLHHDPSGTPYDDIGAMAAALGRAAESSGIGMTLLPVFYAQGGFGGAAPEAGQRRFVTSPDGFARLVERVREIAGTLPDAQSGIAPHSLRAVTPDSLQRVLEDHPGGPVHIHVAEQKQEVAQCLAWSGARPVQWLLDNAAVDGRWCLVHATHMTAAETAGLAASGAVAGLCPVTEANLGDGIFDGVAYLAAGGRFGIGSDSNSLIDGAAELRMLEYSQRLRDGGRIRLAGEGASNGRALYDGACRGGAQAAGRKIGRLAEGWRGDIVALDPDHPALVARRGDPWLDSWLFSADSRAVRDVWVGGRHAIVDGRHRSGDAAREDYRKTLEKLVSA